MQGGRRSRWRAFIRTQLLIGNRFPETPPRDSVDQHDLSACAATILGPLSGRPSSTSPFSERQLRLSLSPYQDTRKPTSWGRLPRYPPQETLPRRHIIPGKFQKRVLFVKLTKNIYYFLKIVIFSLERLEFAFFLSAWSRPGNNSRGVPLYKKVVFFSEEKIRKSTSHPWTSGEVHFSSYFRMDLKLSK
jgi:hypothetical protein